MSKSTSKARILVIEDEPGMRLAMGRILRGFGYNVALAADGIEGLAEFRKAPPDLVVADLYMPDKDGLETIVELMKEFPVPRIIAMSGHRARDLMLRSAQRLGALEIIRKPFSAESLSIVVERVLKTKVAQSGPAKPPATTTERLPRASC